MTDEIRQIFETNRRLLGEIGKAVICFRENRYEEALENIAVNGEDLNRVAEYIIRDREYFKNVSADSIAEMLSGILEASQNGDYVLLADLYEMQVADFICKIQELILNHEELIAYDEAAYRENTSAMKALLREMIEERDDLDNDARKRFRINLNAQLDEPFDAEKMLKKGYALEFTAGGLMTISTPYRNGRIYLHSNGNTGLEAYLLARSWYEEDVDEYVVFGFGMGYHIAQLHRLAPEKRIIVYETSLDILKLYCAFGGSCELLESENVFIVYDERADLIERRLRRYTEVTACRDRVHYRAADGSLIRVCIHYPSYRRTPGCSMLDRAVPWKNKIERL